MNGTPMRAGARSVQLAVMAAPSTTVGEAAAEARRRHATASARPGADHSSLGRRLAVATAT